MQQPAPYGPPPKTRTSIWRQWWVIALLALMAVMGLLQLALGAADDDSATSSVRSAASTRSATTPAVQMNGTAAPAEAGYTAPPATEDNSANAPEAPPAAPAQTTQDAHQDTQHSEESASVPREHRAALAKAQIYSDMMHMSKAGIYDQLVSEFGEGFPADAAQYAVDNVEADWNANALAKAKDYAELMNMSDSAIHDQLTSEYGEKFTVEQADYAIAHLND